MARTASPPLPRNRLLRFLPAAVSLLVAIQFVRWGGVPENAPGLFWLGAATLIATASGAVALAFYLLRGSGATDSGTSVGPSLRQWLALIMLTSGVALGIGALWDEVWHRSYGLPFGEDLLWRPHLLMYAGLVAVMVAAAAGLFFLVKRARGSWRERLRQHPTVTMLVLLGGYLAYALPADPAWHMIYGEDISAWSIPHLLMAVNFAAITLVAAAIQLSTLPQRAWASLRRFRPPDAVVVLAFTFALNLLLQLLTTEWDSLRFIPQAASGPFWDRPAWLLPALLAGLAALAGTLTLHATRLAGTATLVGMLALGLRVALLAAFEIDGPSTDPWLAVLPPLVALDLLYLLFLRPGAGTVAGPGWWAAGLAAALGVAVGTLPLLHRLFIYPTVTAGTLPGMLLWSALGALGAAWLGVRAGDWLAVAHRPKASASLPASLPVWLLPAILLGVVLFAVWFIASASPPV